MNLTKCANNHFYDADRYPSCPHCNGASAASALGQTETVDINLVDKTVGIDDVPSNNTDNASSAKSLEETLKSATTTSALVDDEQKTISAYSMGKTVQFAPVVGWLVCVEGNHKGEDFRLITGRNFVGRSESMEVCLSGDVSISRDRHLIIVFEPKTNTFLVQPGESKELSYLNDEVILQTKEIKTGDLLAMGNSKFVFVSFCTSEMNWSNFTEK